jgi:hypothetical protein
MTARRHDGGCRSGSLANCPEQTFTLKKLPAGKATVRSSPAKPMHSARRLATLTGRLRKLMWRLLSWERIWEQNIVNTMRTSGTWWNRLDGSTSADLQL